MKQGLRSMPILAVADVAAGAAWFRDQLGFAIAGAWTDDSGAATFAIVQMDAITLGLRQSNTTGTEDGWAAYLYLEDIDAYTDQVLGKGAKILRGPEDSFYGCREIEIADPSGNRLCFAQDLKPGPDGPGL